MIDSKKKLQMYLDADKFALGYNKKFPNPIKDSFGSMRFCYVNVNIIEMLAIILGS